jgi:hypothetical protein
VEIKILRSPNDLEIWYLPHGITTLMIQIENDNRQRKLVVRPANRSLPPEYVGYESLRGGKNVHSKDLKIIWGGGMTKGFELNLVPNKKTNLFYLVIHDASNIAEYSFNLEIIEIVGGKKEEFLANKKIVLKPAHNSGNTARMTINYDGVHLRRAEIAGNYIPDYQSRWFGKENYNFRESNIPEFVLSYHVDSEEFVASTIDVKLKSQNGIREIARIGGDLERSKLHAELFNFTDDYCVLRIWLYWVNDLFSVNRLIGGTEYGSRDNTELRSWKRGVIEVPDAERFDLVINKHTEKVSYVGTDLHWRETWWSINGDLANLKFAQMELVPILIKNLPQILSPFMTKRRKKKTESYDPANQLMEKLRRNKLPLGDPVLAVRERTQLVNASGNTELGHGLHRKHVPYILDFNLMPLFVSDVLTEL